jgi:hypothetical protein
MAIITGGLHGRPAGNVAGVVYGAARTRVGKAVTARELVYPSNPQTAAQMLQRHIFMESLSATRNLGAGCWQDNWNRAIGQLPGFHSMMSILLNNTDSSEQFSAPADTPLGDLHYPDTVTITTGTGASGTIDVDYSTETGDNGTNADELALVLIGVDAVGTYARRGVYNEGGATRTDGALVPGYGVADTDIICGVYFIGAGTASGLLSPCKWYSVTTVA